MKETKDNGRNFQRKIRSLIVDGMASQEGIKASLRMSDIFNCISIIKKRLQKPSSGLSSL